MQYTLYAIISTSYFFGLIVIYLGTSELHFCSPHWIQKYLNPKNCQPVQNPLILYYPHAYPPPILSHPMHTLPLFYPAHACPPLFYPTHACPPPILSHLTHTLPPILYQPMHTFPLFYPSPSIPSSYSIPAHAYLPPILSQPMHTFPLF